MDWINYRQLADKEIVTALYADYTTHFERVAKFYSGNYTSNDSFQQKIDILQHKKYERTILHRILNDQNREYHSGIKTLANIDLLGNDNTFAVVTGQQLGLFTGPLYTIYKAITAVKLADKLTRDFPNYNFIPVFWLEGEDHDFDEINKLKLINSLNDISVIEYLIGGKPLERNIGATGSIPIDESIEQFFASVAASMIQTDYSKTLLETMRGYYKPGNTILKAFTGFFNHIFEDSGLVFLNSNNAELKKLLSPLFTKEINSNSEASKLVIQKSAELEEHYHAQIKAKAVNLFMFHKGGRHLIEPSENGDYYLKNLRQRYTKEELLATAATTPDLLSPNVVLRSLCQDTLLPTIAYVAGPAEIAYFAQLKPVYEYFSVTMPIIYPRASVTIVEEKVQKVLEKYSLDLIELFGDAESIIAKVSDQVSEVKVDTLFESLNNRITDAINEARFGIQQIDPTLNGSIDTTLQKFQQQMEVLKQKTQKAQQQKEEISLKQIKKAAMNIFPNGNFQEREFSVVQYLNKYGPDFVKWISNEISIDKFQHQVINI
ncbi:MAG: bacillithiol biosynthesis cysteine-adding enzyme BshC [Ignavibacteriales bacterium]|nr:bacillithiol biosynthesis cysteine-adding enzyme BshC [Ignavibacteriales bacterium]